MALEREKNKLVIEKCQSLLTNLLMDEDNKYCVDCDAKSPRWASWNLGIFLCIRCAGIHRNLGVHISKVKSVNLDSWTPQQVACIQQMGNSRARAVYEAHLQDNFRRPQTDSSLEQFIRAKYEAKKYIAGEWVPPSMPHPTWDAEIETRLRKKKDKKVVSGSVEFPVPVKKSTPKSGGVSPKPLPKAPGGRHHSPNQPKRTSTASSNANQKESSAAEKELSSGTLDLLGLDTPSATNGVSEGDGDIFGDFLTAPPVASSSATARTSPEGKEAALSDESNFFNQKLPDAAEKLSKDSILALYNQTPPSHTQPATTQPTVYGGGGGGMFLGGAGGMPMCAPQPVVGVVPPPQQQQMFFQHQAPLGVPVGGMQPPFYPQGMGGAMYPGVPVAAPPGVPAGVQLSAANPFAQMQAQMGTMNLGGGMVPGPPPPQQQQQQPVGNPLLMGNLMGGGGGGLSATPRATTLSTNLWQ